MSFFSFILIIAFTITGSLSSAGGLMTPLPSTGGELCNKWYNGKLAGFQFWGRKASDDEIIECVGKVGVNFSDLYGNKPFDHAVAYPHVTVSRLALLRSLGANVDFSNLISAAAGSSKPEVIFYLLAEGVDVNSQKKQNDALNALIRNRFDLWKNEELRVALGGPKSLNQSEALGGPESIEQSESNDGRFAYPVNGKIFREYVENKTDGIDISAPEGSVVFAAETGVVAGITADPLGVPIIVLKHEEKLLTVYSGLGSITVKEREQVFRGQVIGKVGPGNPSFLHFQVRKGFKVLDPMDFLEPEKITKNDRLEWVCDGKNYTIINTGDGWVLLNDPLVEVFTTYDGFWLENNEAKTQKALRTTETGEDVLEFYEQIDEYKVQRTESYDCVFMRN